MQSPLLTAARERQRIETMRAIAAIAIHMFCRRGYDEVTVENVAEEAGVSPATIYRRFGTKENLVCWQPDEQQAFQGLRERLGSGTGILDAALEMIDSLPDEAIDAVESTARLRLDLIAAHPQLQAAAAQKSAAFTAEVLGATEDHDRRSRLQRETEAACVGAAMDAATRAWVAGHGTLRDCMRESLATLRSW